MAVGDLITGATQYEYAGVLMGSGTNYVVESMEGLDDMPELRTDDTERQDDHGEIPGLDLLPARMVVATLSIHDDTHALMMARYRTLARMMRPATTLIPFAFQRPGEVKKQIFVRPRRRNLPSNYEVAHGLAKGAALAWKAPDPRIFALVQKSAVITIAAGATSASATVTNAGDFRTEMTLTIAGQGTNPRVAVSAQTPDPDGFSYNGRTFAIDYAMGTGDTFAVDFDKKTIKLNGVNSYSKKRTDSQWFELMPGAQTITVSRTGTTGTQTYTVYWYDAWI